jgi:hypothetical protein
MIAGVSGGGGGDSAAGRGGMIAGGSGGDGTGVLDGTGEGVAGGCGGGMIGGCGGANSSEGFGGLLRKLISPALIPLVLMLPVLILPSE